MCILFVGQLCFSLALEIQSDLPYVDLIPKARNGLGWIGLRPGVRSFICVSHVSTRAQVCGHVLLSQMNWQELGWKWSGWN